MAASSSAPLDISQDYPRDLFTIDNLSDEIRNALRVQDITLLIRTIFSDSINPGYLLETERNLSLPLTNSLTSFFQNFCRLQN